LINSDLREENSGIKEFFEEQIRQLAVNQRMHKYSLINSDLREENSGIENFSLEKF